MGVKSAAEAKEAYLKAIKALGGAAAYYECGAKRKVKEVAECLQSLKKQRVNEEVWAERYAAAYE